ncbi:MAG: hypothetical protein M0Q90_15035 [Bacteroidales bacterium]|nr:hypothetical protein [Bacteroidales bacterium]
MKMNRLFLILAVAIATAFTSCKKDDDIVNPEPTIDFKGGANYTSTDVTINTGDEILVGFNAAYNMETGEELTNFKLTLTSNNIPQIIMDSTLKNKTFSTDVKITFPDAGTARLEAKITDKAGRTAAVSFNIIVEQAGVKVVRHTNVELGSWNDDIGSFYSAKENLIFTVPQAMENQAKVDFIFYKGVTNMNTITAPDDASLSTIPSFRIDEWATKNETRFVLTSMTAAEFDAIGDYYEFTEFEGNSGESKVINLEDGAVVKFRTQAGAYGLIKVVNFYSRGDMGVMDVIIME